MGLETALIIGASAAIAGASAGYSIYLMRKTTNNPNGMPPASLDDFGITQASEGQCIPLVYGRVRIPGNIIYYGNLVTEEISESVGGKGGGGDQVTGYKYYLNCWQALCEGKIELLDTYINDKPTNIEAAATCFNDGTGAGYPIWPGEFASSLPGIAHIAYEKWFVGENVSSIPTVHFIVNRILPGTINHANMLYGNNPAAIIYDLLSKKVPGDQINTATFNKAADFWYDKNYALSLIFSSKSDVEPMINQVLKYVDGAVYQDYQGRYAITAFDPADTSVTTITQDDFIEFELTRISYNETANDFQGTFTDARGEYSKRTIVSTNAANMALIGRKITESIDLEAFTDLDAASRRIAEIKKRRSYPHSLIDFSTDLRFEMLEVGSIATIQNSDYGIVSADFRITNIDYSTIEENQLKFQGEQVIEGLFDDVYALAGGTEWTAPDTDLVASTKISAFEMPWSLETGEEPTYLLLVSREKFETGFDVMFSATGLDYTFLKACGTFSQYGKLDIEYPGNTRSIDDIVGILYTPYKFDPTVSSISRTDLFYRRRVAIIENEIVGFQTIVPEGPASYRLKGVVRGVLNTPISAHPADSAIWLTEISDRNLVSGITASSFYLKYIPRYGTKSLSPGLATAIPVSYTAKARIPGKPYLEAMRISGSNVDFEIFPILRNKNGSGAEPENIYLSPPAPFEIEGDFEIDSAGSKIYQASTNFSLDIGPGLVSLLVKHRINGRLSPEATILVASGARKYFSN